MIQNALREQEKFGMEPLKDLKRRRESGTMNPRPQAKVKKGAKEKEARLSIIEGREKLRTPLNCLVAIGREAMGFASTQMRAGTAMMALKVAVLRVLLWP